jgi:hypothetical protein
MPIRKQAAPAETYSSPCKPATPAKTDSSPHKRAAYPPAKTTRHRKRENNIDLPLDTPKIDVLVPPVARDEWRKIKDLRHILRGTGIRVYRCSSPLFATLVESPPGNPRNKWTSEERAAVKRECVAVERELALWTDGNGSNLVLYFLNFVNEGLAKCLESTIHQLTVKINPSPPARTRHQWFEAWNHYLPEHHVVFIPT